MRRLGRALARLFVKLRYLVVLAWIGGAVWAGFALPPISGKVQRSFTALVPPHAPAVQAERISAQRFGFPLLARTFVVIRNPHGLSQARQYQIVSLAHQLNGHRLPGYRMIAGAAPLLNTVGSARFAPEHGTTALLYLYFRRGVSSLAQTTIATRLADTELGRRPGEYLGVSGTMPAQGAQTELINNRLLWVTLATILVVALAIAFHFRAFGAAGLAILTVGIAYVVASRLVEQFGNAAHLTIPAEAQPVLVVLVFGIVTDYSIFFLSRFRALLAEGEERQEAATRVIREIAPIVATAGVTVAAGTAGLLAATMGFLRGFGPGLAIAVLISMAVAITFVPAALAVGGKLMFWPRGLVRAADVETSAGQPLPGGRRILTVRLAARHPLIATVLVLALIGGAASGLARMAVGNEIVRGLPAGSEIHHSYSVAERGFAPGVLSPTMVVLTGSGVGRDRDALARLQQLIARQPDVAQVLGPRQELLGGRVGFATARRGNAARYVVFLDSDPLGPRAISAVRGLRGRLPGLLTRAGLTGATPRVGGDTAISADIVGGTVTSLERVIPTVLTGIFVVIAIFLQALVAPIYLVLTSLLAVIATLGLTVYVMQMLLGYGQITYYVLFTVAVLLISLGSDYNVFVVGRIWQEGRRRPLRDAVEVAGTRAARPITTAGLVLASSFALLAIVPVNAFREIAFAMAVGLLIDAFVVRSILVPALMTLVGPRSAWPGRRLRRSAPPRRIGIGEAPAGAG